MSQIVNQIQFKRSDKTLADLSSTKLKYGEPVLLTNSDNRALVIGNSSENDALSNDYFIPIGTREDIDKGYMVKGVDYVTAGQKSGSTLGQKSTTEGNDTTASGSYSHAEGDSTTANHKSQHVFGEYNIADASAAAATARGNYIEIVGNGTASNALSNARTLDWSGNETLAGKLTLGAGPTNNLDAATKKYVDDAIPAGAVTSVRVQATSPVVSSQNTAQTSTLNTTISLADGYGDTKNPYASKAKNLVLATPASTSGAPSFRALAFADIPAGTTYAPASVPNNTNLGTNGSIKAVYDATKHSTATASLTVAGWNSSNQQTVTVSGVTASNLVTVSPAPTSWDVVSISQVYCSAQAANSLTFKCKVKPTDAITMNVVIWS